MGVATGFLLLALVPSAAAQADPLTPEERAWVEAHGPIRHAPDPNYPPFESYDDQGQLIGINADVLNRISRALQVEFVTARQATWKDALDSLRNGTVDLLGSVAPTAERETWMDFTEPFAVYGEVFYVKDPSLRTEADLVGKRVGVVKDYAAATWLADHRPQLTLTAVSDTLTGLNMLNAGELDAFFENVPVAGFYIRSTSLLDIRVLGSPLYYSPSSWAVAQGNAVLLSIVQKGLDSIPPGELGDIFEYWTGSDISPRLAVSGGFTPLQRNLVVGVGLVAVGAAAWNISLRRTVRRRTRELEASRNDLERRVKERTQDLERVNSDLQAFSYTISHDLRTPLTSIGAFNEALQRKYGDRLDQDGNHYSLKIREGVQRMSQLIDDILKFSKANRQELDLRPVDLSEMAAQVASAIRERTPSRRATFVIAPGMRAKGDARLLRIALENLLENAWKFTRDRPEARIEVGQAKPGNGMGSFFVRDNGAGFDPAKASQLFRPFQRLHETGRFEGSGIGLSTVRRIMERHGGDVRAVGEIDGGATFHFTLPESGT